MPPRIVTRRVARLRLYLNLIRWDRPAGWLLLLWPTLSALWIANKGFPGWHLLAVFIAGTILMRSAGCCINDVADRNFDRHVKRTAQRPVTSGVISSKEALGVGAILALLALGCALTTRFEMVLWAIPAFVITLVYPYTKRFLSMPQAVLGVAFSMGIPMAFVASDALAWYESAHVWGLIAGNLCWVLAYDTQYAMVDRDDDRQIGLHTSAITLGDWDVTAVMAFYILHLGLWWWVGQAMDFKFWFYAGLAVAAIQVLWHFQLIRQRSREGCFKAFSLNHWLGLSNFIGLTLELGFKA